MTSPFRRLYHVVKGGVRHDKDMDRCPEADACLLRYEKEVRRQQNPYAEWINEENNACNQKDGSGKEITVNGWQAVSVPGTEIVLLTYGQGMLDKNAFGEVKSCFDKNTYSNQG